MVLAHNIYDGRRTRDVKILEDTTFDSMLISPTTLEGLNSSGFYKPSPIQLHSIPLGKCGFDLLLEAKSGTGKTAVFSVVALDKLNLEQGLQAVILAPTREIAAQISQVIKQIGSKYKGLRIEVVMGGLPLKDDIVKFKNKDVHIVVGSPGRLRNLIQENHVDVTAVRLLVLDEADKLMEKSFQTDINYIFSSLPVQKQVIMSSATYTANTKAFINRYVRNAQHVHPDSTCILLGIQQKVTTVKYNCNIVKQTKYRFQELLKILSKKPFKQCLIFCNYQARVTELHKMLTKERWPSEQLYGNQDQIDRLDALKTLQEYKCRILVSTDLAARGIDASNVDLVINFEPPVDWQTYLHRIGRAGRFGAYGIAISILSEGKEQTKFYETLATIKAPLNLTGLWDNNTIDSEDMCKAPSLPIDESNNKSTDNLFVNLWKVLTCKNETSRAVESFQNLFASFQSTKDTNIEFFTDLVNSFTSHSPDDVHNDEPYSKYRHFDVLKLPDGEYINAVRVMCDKHNKKGVVETLNLNGPLDSNTAQKNSNILFDYLQCDEERNNKHFEDPERLSTKSFESTSDIDCELGTSDSEYDLNNENDALRQAGLPTSFGSTKFNFKKPKEKKHKLMNKKKTYNGAQRNKDCHDSSSSNLVSSHDLYNEEKPTANSQRKNKNHNISQPQERTQYNRVTDNDDFEYNTMPQEQSKFPSNGCSNHEMANDSSRLSQEYINWYNRLKFQINQIELAFYIEEMSKI